MHDLCLSKVGSDVEIPKQHQIGGPMLDLNIKTKYDKNKEKLLKRNAQVFCLAMMVLQ